MDKPALLQQTLNSTYRLETMLSDTGRGEVYEAAHLRLGRRFAIKVLKSDAHLNDEARERFGKAMHVVSMLTHPHIVEVTDFFRHPDGRPCVVMELLRGQHMGVRLNQKGQFGIAEAVLFLRQLANGLQTAHKKGVIHGDLHPRKVMLCPTKGRDDAVKLIGFGITQPIGPEASETATVEDLTYAAPEQISKGTSDARTDVYASGALLFEMLSGKPPFSGASAQELRDKVASAEAPLLRSVREDAPEALEYVIAKALRKEPERRFHSMGAFWREFSSASS